MRVAVLVVVVGVSWGVSLRAGEVPFPCSVDASDKNLTGLGRTRLLGVGVERAEVVGVAGRL